MNPETFMWLALEAFALAGVVVLGWVLFHFAPPRDEDELPPHLREAPR